MQAGFIFYYFLTFRQLFACFSGLYSADVEIVDFRLVKASLFMFSLVAFKPKGR
jgi:hypothetical protein